MVTATVLCTFADIALDETFFYTFPTDQRFTNKPFARVKARKTVMERPGLAGECCGVECGTRFAATGKRRVLKIL